MKIVIVENGSGDAREHTFEKPVIKIGRTAAESDIDLSNWRMVSRSHAEIRFEQGNWVLRDLLSTFGTYVDEKRATQPTVLSVGTAIQFGEGGPIAHVIWLEGAANEGASIQNSPIENSSANLPVKQAQPSAYAQKIPNAPDEIPSFTPRRAPSVFPKIEFLGNQAGRSFDVAKPEIWFGRDPGCDIAFAPSATMVSRRHAVIRERNGAYFIEDNGSFNGTIVNDQRIGMPTELFDKDEIILGIGGPGFRFSQLGKSPHRAAEAATAEPPSDIEVRPLNGTMIFNMGDISALPKNEIESQLLLDVDFGNKTELSVGRSKDNDIPLEGLLISNRHARLKRTNSGIEIEDLNSTNGVYVNGELISRRVISSDDSVQIGAFVLRIERNEEVLVFDTRSRTRIDSVGITKEAKDRAHGGKIRLLDDISLTIQPNEFVGLIGPSGAGKSTLIDALNGTLPVTSGVVYVNNLDLYRHLDSLKQSIGYVPQDDIIHRELSVYDTLFYVAKLRLSRDVSKAEINQIIEEILDVTGLSERRNVLVKNLSGGQRKRVSIAVELITKPSVIFLDEPTSGLDPATEQRIMKLFRRIAESGRTVVLTTHVMESLTLFDKIAVLIRGKLAFYGSPEEAKNFFGATSYRDLFERLESPGEAKSIEGVESNSGQITEKIAEDWKRRFRETPEYEKNVEIPISEVNQRGRGKATKRNRIGMLGSTKQFATLTTRYAHVYARDKLNLLILFSQAPIIAFLVFFVMGADMPRDFAYFALSLCSIWFGTSVAAREIVRERPIYKRERMVNMGLLPYLGSKLVVLGVIVFVQCLLLWIPLKFFDLTGLMPMPGQLLGIPQFLMMLLTASVGVGLGLFVSALVRTSEMATSLIPLILIPQIIFSGLIGVPQGVSKVIGLTMPAAWSYDSMKRLSSLDTLEPEGAKPDGQTKGLGLFQFIEEENDKMVEKARQDMSDYQKSLQSQADEASRKVATGEPVSFVGVAEPPKMPDPIQVPKNLSDYVTFLNPWMHGFLNPLVLIFMFFSIVILTLIALRVKDN